MTDRRNHCRADPPRPSRNSKKCLQVWLDPKDYRRLYNITVERGESMAEVVRKMIRATPCEFEDNKS